MVNSIVPLLLSILFLLVVKHLLFFLSPQMWQHVRCKEGCPSLNGSCWEKSKECRKEVRALSMAKQSGLVSSQNKRTPCETITAHQKQRWPGNAAENGMSVNNSHINITHHFCVQLL